jgi:hypothetical protein
MKNFMAFIGSVVTIPALFVLRGWVISVLWRWFMVSQFHQPALGIAEAIGVGIVVTTVVAHSSTCQEDPKYTNAVKFGIGIVGPLMGLLCGWIVKFFL